MLQLFSLACARFGLQIDADNIFAMNVTCHWPSSVFSSREDRTFHPPTSSSYGTPLPWPEHNHPPPTTCVHSSPPCSTLSPSPRHRRSQHSAAQWPTTSASKRSPPMSTKSPSRFSYITLRASTFLPTYPHGFALAAIMFWKSARNSAGMCMSCRCCSRR